MSEAVACPACKHRAEKQMGTGDNDFFVCRGGCPTYKLSRHAQKALADRSLRIHNINAFRTLVQQKNSASGEPSLITTADLYALEPGLGRYRRR